MQEIKTIGVLGAGMMGADIALVCATAGYKVLMKEVSSELAEAGHRRIDMNIEKWTKKGKLDLGKKDKSAILDSIVPTATYDGFEDVDLVIEAIIEDINIKTATFQELDKICKPDCMIASNTSSISITKLGACFESEQRKKQFLGLHFFSPASIMNLVEVIKGEETSEETMTSAINFCKSIGKEPVKVIDCVGFIVNRILFALQNEAIRLYEENIASTADIDKACRLGLGHPVGPFELMDLTSIDLYLKVGNILKEAYGERFHCRPIAVKKVDAGHLGRKAKKGWHEYN